MPTRQEIFAQAASKLRKDFDELSVVPHSGLKGGEAEALVRRFLKGHIPKRFDVTSGFIIDGRDAVSKQTDVIIYDAMNCPAYRASENASIIPNDNVAAVVEVKSSLDKERLKEAFENIWAAKALAKVRVPDPGFLVMNGTLGCVFAFNTPLKLETISDHYLELLRSRGVLGPHIDFIAVLDRGIINLVASLPSDPGWSPLVIDDGMGGARGEGAHIGIGIQEIGADTLDYFLRFLVAQLAHFRPFVPHPGWSWAKTSSGGLGRITYLTSFTNEKDPAAREARLKEYAAQVREQSRAAEVLRDASPVRTPDSPDSHR
jgi:hypothetical protein